MIFVAEDEALFLQIEARFVEFKVSNFQNDI